MLNNILKKISVYTIMSVLFLGCKNNNSENNYNEMQILDMPKYGFKLEFSKKWKLKENKIKGIICSLLLTSCEETTYFCPNIVLSIHENKTLDVKNLIEFYSNELKTKFDKYKILGLDTLSGNRYVLNYNMFDEDKHLGGTSAFIPIGDSLLIVNCMGPNKIPGEYINYKNDFIEVISSIKIN